MIYKMKLLTLVVSLFLLTKSAVGQEGLIEIYQRALQNDPMIREAEANYLVMLETKPQARSAVLPSLTLSAGASVGNSTNPNPATNFMTGEPSKVVVSSESRRDSSDWSVALTQTL
ncbi:MAG: TolC family protein, partial [Pseudomonadota bacterium]|nr:TolC family protein [Pseudomonadota bacterium]